MKKIFLLLFLLMIPSVANAACDDPLKDGVESQIVDFLMVKIYREAIFQIQTYHLQVSFKLISIRV